MRKRIVSKALSLDKKVKKWSRWQEQCKCRVKELKKEFRKIVKDMNMEEILKYGEKAGYFPQEFLDKK